MIEFKTGNFDWNKHLIDQDTNLPKVALVFCHSSAYLNEWADIKELPKSHRCFGDGRSSEEVVIYFSSFVKMCKDTTKPIILTTHRIELMSNELSRPDCIFVLPVWEKIAKPIWTLTDKELRFAHNLERMYRSGMFG